MQSLGAPGGIEDNAAYTEYQSRALTAVEAIVGLAQILPTFHFSKVGWVVFFMLF
jgi:hypothetical protein